MYLHVSSWYLPANQSPESRFIRSVIDAVGDCILSPSPFFSIGCDPASERMMWEIGTDQKLHLLNKQVITQVYQELLLST